MATYSLVQGVLGKSGVNVFGIGPLVSDLTLKFEIIFVSLSIPPFGNASKI